MGLVDSVALYLEECSSKITVKSFFLFLETSLIFILYCCWFFTFEYVFIFSNCNQLTHLILGHRSIKFFCFVCLKFLIFFCFRIILDIFFIYCLWQILNQLGVVGYFKFLAKKTHAWNIFKPFLSNQTLRQIGR